MAIEIRIESSWDTDDGEGRKVEVSVVERLRPSDDPIEDSRFFASGDVESLKRYLSDLIDRRQRAFMPPHARECARCGKVRAAKDEARSEFICESCRADVPG